MCFARRRTSGGGFARWQSSSKRNGRERRRECDPFAVYAAAPSRGNRACNAENRLRAPAAGRTEGRQDSWTFCAIWKPIFAEDISIDDLAAQFFISKYHMMRRFREETGIHPQLSLRQTASGGARSYPVRTFRHGRLLPLRLSQLFRLFPRLRKALRRHADRTHRADAPRGRL